ncbi:MAG: T7 exonuclease [Clostridia bacterium]|nr:T7 exonuclease [Clostridia bacterium]
MDLMIDADILACQYAYAYEATRGWDADGALDMDGAVWDDAGWAISGFDSAIERMLRETRTEKALLCFTGLDNFRYSILPTYKSNRRGKPKPVLLDALIEHSRQVWDCKEEDCLEADDVMGIMATRSPGSYVIATTDKDLRQIPGTHYNWRKRLAEEVTTCAADYWFHFQVLAGDSTDGYSGCPGVGVCKAKAILEGAGEDPWASIVTAFESKGFAEEDALIQARVARILRCGDYDFRRRKPILWRPGPEGARPDR